MARRVIVVESLTVFGMCIALFMLVQFSISGLAGYDGYYHMKMGLLIRNSGLKPDFPFLPMTILNENAYVDHHFLYHIALSLFATADPVIDRGAQLTLNAKLASVIFPSIAFIAVWWLLRTRQVPLTFCWTIGLFGVSGVFLYRLSMPRAQSISLLIIVLALYFLTREAYHYLFLLGFIYVWAYVAFLLILVPVVSYICALWLIERRVAWRAVVFPVLGLFLGNILNPYFPENLVFNWQHIFLKLVGQLEYVGGEWSSYNTWELVENSGFALVALVVGVIFLISNNERPKAGTFTAFFISLGFGLLLMRSRRFIEYFPAFALIFLAFSASPFVEDVMKSSRRKRNIMYITFFVVLIVSVAHTIRSARSIMMGSPPPDMYADASIWLQRHAEYGDLVFTTDWDDFPRLFFYNSKVYYLVGLDPTFFQKHDPELFALWVGITQGRLHLPSKWISENYGAKYVFSDLHHYDFLKIAASDPGLQEVYRDEYAVIFSVKRN